MVLVGHRRLSTEPEGSSSVCPPQRVRRAFRPPSYEEREMAQVARALSSPLGRLWHPCGGPSLCKFTVTVRSGRPPAIRPPAGAPR